MTFVTICSWVVMGFCFALGVVILLLILAALHVTIPT